MFAVDMAEGAIVSMCARSQYSAAFAPAYDHRYSDDHAVWQEHHRRLGLRPRERFLFVAKLETSGFAIEFPVDFGASAIHPAVPGSNFPAQGLQVRDSSGTEALPREDADFDFRLIEPTAVSGGVVNCEPVPDLTAELRTVEIGERLSAMDVQVVHYQVDGLSLRVLKG